MFLRTIAASTALALLVHTTPARADEPVRETWANNFWGRTWVAGPGEVPAAKRAVVLTLMGAMVVGWGVAAYYFVDAQVQYANERSFVSSHGGNSNFCLQRDSAACSDYLALRNQRYSDTNRMVTFLGAGTLVGVAGAITALVWPNSPVVVSPSVGTNGGGLRLEGAF